MRRIVAALPIVLACVTSVLAQSNAVIFDNQSGEPALVKLVGPTAREIDVATGSKGTVTAAAGHYYIKVRYGLPGNFRYTKGDEFEVTETATAASETTITLHKVVAGNYASEPSTENEFEADGQGVDRAAAVPEQKASAPPVTEQRAAVATDSGTSERNPDASIGAGVRQFLEERGGIAKQYEMVRGNDPDAPQIVVLLSRGVAVAALQKEFGKPDKVENNCTATLLLDSANFLRRKGACWRYGQVRVFLDGQDVMEVAVLQ